VLAAVCLSVTLSSVSGIIHERDYAKDHVIGDGHMMYAHSPDGDTAAPWRSVGSLSTCCCCYWSQYITSNFAMYMQRVCNSCGNYSIALEGRFIDVQKRRLCICIYVYINPIINHQADTRQEGD